MFRPQAEEGTGRKWGNRYAKGSPTADNRWRWNGKQLRTLESGYHRRVAHQLYRAAGMRDEGLYFRIYL
ncbi:hypothetical protein [Thermaerobacter composti]|uniref:Uncharacterized protein n=1 Tax=Thermaerobacter composti TaxID=554949 RepID=A0ABZ0QQH7_9FIRM|nr:hypothetical protein [Thermaerobacter composti]WPD19738.1 hypothetical protein Q5761_03485 [Thermaerobacter composti]